MLHCKERAGDHGELLLGLVKPQAPKALPSRYRAGGGPELLWDVGIGQARTPPPWAGCCCIGHLWRTCAAEVFDPRILRVLQRMLTLGHQDIRAHGAAGEELLDTVYNIAQLCREQGASQHGRVCVMALEVMQGINSNHITGLPFKGACSHGIDATQEELDLLRNWVSSLWLARDDGGQSHHHRRSLPGRYTCTQRAL